MIDILNRGAPVALLALGMTLVIATGGIDLSVGSVIAFTGVLLAKLIGTYGIHPMYAFAIAGGDVWRSDGLDY
ncbi:inner membrane ABC transporter permease YjfF [Yersinia aldovae]|nr:inner membrane ABC transporter permease YjfF [Yersinia aldovae]